MTHSGRPSISSRERTGRGAALTLDADGSSLHDPLAGSKDVPAETSESKPAPPTKVNEESRVPMPGETDQGGAGGSGSGAVPDDTFHLVTGQSSAKPAEESKSGSTAGGAASTVDSMLGRLVIELGLATKEEVRQAQEKHKSIPRDDPNQRSLAQILVEDEFLTRRQVERLRKQVEEERKGQAIAGYKVLSKLGAGAMATVFKAKQLSLDRLVAIKILPRKFSSNAQFIERFYAEGRAAAQLNHPNIVQAYDVGQSGEFHYFVMEYVDGSTVHDVITANKRFKEADALNIAISVAEALEHAHDRGLIHRDVKPKNIMLTKQGLVKVADLGLARAIEDKDAALAEAGKAYGTPYYISPEQIRGEVNIGPQADIYSLGATLYHMVTGNVPFNGKNPTEVMQKHLKSALVPPDHVNPTLSAGFSEVIEMMMAKSRKNRYKDCHDLLEDLRAVKKGEPPPIAHTEAPAAALEELLSSEAAQSKPNLQRVEPKDVGPFDHPSARMVLYMCIAMTAFAILMTVAAAIGWFGR